MTGRATDTQWTADDPIQDDEQSPDRLDRAGFADSAAALLEQLGARGGSSVAALIGPWGAGKSSTLNMIRSRLRPVGLADDLGWVIIDFNPWYYADLASLQIGFFRELSAPLPSTARSIRSKIAELGQATAPLGSILSIFGVDASSAIDAASKLVGGDQSLQAITAATNQELTDFGRPILVVVDDLDRLSPDELLLVFKLLRLTGRLQNVHYLISFDEDTLLDALTRTGLVGESDPRRAVDYLEKMIQIRLDLPPIRETQIEAWLNEGLDQIAAPLGLDTASQPLRRFSSAYESLLRRRLNTPRAIRRFLAQAEAFMPRNTVDIDFEDYLVLAWIRAAEPLLYKMIKTQRDALVGGRGSSSINALLRSQKQTDQKAPWEKVLSDAHIPDSDLEDVAELLCELFPRFERQWRNEGGSPARDVPGPRIGNSDYFDRYFHFGVPEEDISDQTVREAYNELTRNQPGHSLARVEDAIVVDVGRVLSKLELANEADASGSEQLLRWFLTQELRVEGGTGFIDDHRRLRHSGARVFSRLAPPSIDAIVEHAVTLDGGLAAIGDWLHSGLLARNSAQLTVEKKAAMNAAQARTVVLLEEHFTVKAQVSPLDLADYDWSPIWDWVRLDPEGLRTWVHQQFINGTWMPLDLVARFVTTSTIMGVPEAESRISGLDFATVDAVIGIDYLLNELAGEISAVESSPFRNRTTSPTRELRREFALQVLRAKRDDPDYEVN